MTISRPPSLRSIAAFEAAARHESFAKAAEELNLTQSAISHSIRALEEQLGQQLFERNGRYLSLTPGGRWLAQRLRSSLAQISDALCGVGTLERAARLTVAAPTMLFARLLLDGWRGIGAKHAQLSLEVRCSPDGAGLCERGDADLEITRIPPRAAALAVAAIPCGSVLAVGSPRLQRMSPANWPLVETPDNRWATWSPQAESMRRRAPDVVVANDDFAVDAARLGVGACLIPQRLVAEELRNQSLVVLAQSAAQGSDGCWAVWRRGSPRSAAIEDLVDRLASTPAEPPVRWEPDDPLRCRTG